ncbi:uncharacterized protein BDR25DRAFT_350773 [Lindgomyces ingoldianus]|uniref:Uncharacterized protein n=1 Tax=Lindgomyces ingoldianus TaxID=673940 RepID=A0ACB6R7V7_9PLEO|nr:uncharacterized protein BDR25DRAFT_350773 [Lindgomyces ingoldianus]KAF2475398.1 hypothetical protein BDR25DRAFT_350773 [Lindgomyces ingoldianus]
MEVTKVFSSLPQVPGLHDIVVRSESKQATLQFGATGHQEHLKNWKDSGCQRGERRRKAKRNSWSEKEGLKKDLKAEQKVVEKFRTVGGKFDIDTATNRYAGIPEDKIKRDLNIIQGGGGTESACSGLSSAPPAITVFAWIGTKCSSLEASIIQQARLVVGAGANWEAEILQLRDYLYTNYELDMVYNFGTLHTNSLTQSSITVRIISRSRHGGLGESALHGNKQLKPNLDCKLILQELTAMESLVPTFVHSIHQLLRMSLPRKISFPYNYYLTIGNLIPANRFPERPHHFSTSASSSIPISPNPCGHLTASSISTNVIKPSTPVKILILKIDSNRNLSPHPLYEPSQIPKSAGMPQVRRKWVLTPIPFSKNAGTGPG